MSADSPSLSSGIASRCVTTIPAIVPPQVVSDRSILDSAIGFINEVTLAHQPPLDPNDTITWAKFESGADISDPRFGEDWEIEGNVAPPLLLILGYGLGVQVWAIPANGEAVEVLSWRHGIVSVLKVLPTPLLTVAVEENGRADEPIDVFGEKRPLIALVDGSSSSGSQSQFCAVNFVSLKTGAQVKTIKFQNPVLDILANRSSVVITFHERIAVFDARTLEDRLTITTCYPSPGINPNPAALGPRWLAYAENKLLHTKRSGGGCDGDGVASYTAAVLNASKSLVKGLRELGEQVAAGLTGTSVNTTNSKNASFDASCGFDTKQAGVVTIIDIKHTARDYSPTSGNPSSSMQAAGADTIIAHFLAHSEALVALEFDNSGILLVTADRRGHDFHVFRIQPNPIGSSLAAVHHLYILHRGDTSAKVQNITLTLDSRWVAVSTLRGTTHVFPITPYGGSMGVRTHTSLHVVNKLSRFHRSAGLSGEGRSNSPIAHSESTFSQSLQPYNNSTLPPFPRPTVVMPLAQLRQPFALGSPPGSASLSGAKSVAGVIGSGSQRQRLSSLSDDSGNPLSVCAVFAKSRSWLLDPPNSSREAPHRMQRKAVDSLFIMAGHGALIQYDLDTKLASNVVKEKICDDTPIELEVEAKAQWNLGRHKEGFNELMPPLRSDNWLIKNRNSCMLNDSSRQYDDMDDRTESWLSQVEIITHAGPHRRLWMGPQFVFKTYNTPSGSNLNHVDTEAVEIGTIKSSSVSNPDKFEHSNPLNMPLAAAGRSSAVPVLIESGSYSSIEQSPKLMDRFRHDHMDSDYSVSHGDSRLKEDLADAMRESPSAAASAKDVGGHVFECGSARDNGAFSDALKTEDEYIFAHAHLASAAALASVLPNIHSFENSSSYELLDSKNKTQNSIEKIVNPLGTVTTIISCLSDVKTDILDEVVSQLAKEDTIIHENCDESLFRPVVAIFCDEKDFLQNEEEARKLSEQYQPPEVISSKLVVPVIAKEINDELRKREREKTITSNPKTATSKYKNSSELTKFEVMPLSNKTPKEDKKTKLIEEQLCGVAKKTKKVKISGILADIQAQPNIEASCDKNDFGNSNCTTTLKGTATELQMIQKIKTKKEIHDKRPKELPEHKESIKTDLIGSQKIQQEIKINIQTGKETKASKNETNLSVSNEQDETKITNDAKKIVNKDESQRFTETVYNVDQKEVAKTKSEENVILPTCVLNNAKDATKEKIKKNKDSTKYKKFCTGQDLNELKKNEKKVEFKETTKSKMTSSKSCNENVLITNPFVSESQESFKSKTCSEKDIEDVSNTMDTNEMRLCEKKSKIGVIELSKKLCKKDQDLDKERSNTEQRERCKGQIFKTYQPINEYSNLDKGTSHNIKGDDDEVKKASNTEQQYSNFLKPTEIYEEKTTINYFQCNETPKGTMRTDKNVNTLETKIKSEKLQSENNSDQGGKAKYIKEIFSIKNVKTAKINSNIDHLSENDKGLSKVKQDEFNQVKTNCLITQETFDTNKELKTDVKTNAKSFESEILTRTPCLNPTSQKEKEKETSKLEISKRKASNLTTSGKDNEENRESNIKNGNVKEDASKLKCEDIKKTFPENTINVSKIQIKDTERLTGSILPPASVWKTLSGADMMNKNVNKTDYESNKSAFGGERKIKISSKLLPEIPTPVNIDNPKNLDEFLILKSLDPLPPLPDLELLMTRDESLIRFENPSIENQALQRKLTPAPRGFTEHNLILALCGSLHFENEQIEKPEVSPTVSSNHSSSAFEETSLAEYKSITENDDPYISYEQSSQDTNTTNTNTTNEKFFSSTNSSGSEEIVKTDEKKMTKKQKRKKQQQQHQLKDAQKEQDNEIDEELRPLITMTESQVYQMANNSNEALPSYSASLIKTQSTVTHPLLYSTTTDSEGPLPTTTSDDNVFSIPVSGVYNTHKIKTKKLEHKINLIAAIEAATSSSTSSAEESGIELGGRNRNDNSEPLISEANPISTLTIPLPIMVSSQTTVGGLKKKTKRRKR